MAKQNIPQHVGIIMDGNRRWARKHGVSTLEGHKKGYEQAKKIVEYGFKKGIKYLTLYAFSAENWKRSRQEVNYLMNLFISVLKEQARDLHQKGIRLLVVGSRSRLTSRLVNAIDAAQEMTKMNKKGTLIIAFNYGGRNDIIEAIQLIIKKHYSWKDITEKLMSTHLSTAGLPDPDLIIRTSGEKRLSGFLLWPAAYSELHFTSTLWPSFSTVHFDSALETYHRRIRRFGG